MVKKGLSVLIFSFTLFFSANFCFAEKVEVEASDESEVNLTANVVERKPTDTINDFDFTSLTGNSQMAKQEDGSVKGVSDTGSPVVNFFDTLKHIISSILEWTVNIFQ
jgi:hypothetical protein